ncbi:MULTISPECIES: prolipoprotein diacylglyceryl transferase [unclassified Pseudomonas]|uniref:prolipoprotein diacylglyceryl transferase n=1 Tax=unclassified Pseudomonas TaxID=196821 RepID=UPI0030DA14E2
MEQYFVWNTDPVLMRFGVIDIHWYGVLFAAAFGFGMAIMRFIFRREGKPEGDLDALLIYLGLGTVLGARLGHVLFYDPAFYFSNPAEILAIWKGGLASHGGAIGLALSLYLFCRRRSDIGYLWLLDRIAIVALLGGGLIRVGNFFNSEIAGVPTDIPWAIVFSRIDTLPRHPTQLYEACVYFVMFLLMFLLYQKRRTTLEPGFLSGLFLSAVFSARFLLEFTKMHQASYDYPLPLNVGQLLSIPPVLVGLTLMVLAKRSGRKLLCEQTS